MPEDELTIDELARRAGMTVRNVRAHQSRGLLPPPAVRARTGYYGREHLARLRMIQELQAEGFNLKSIQRLIDAVNGAGEQVLDFERTLITSFVAEEPEFATIEDLEKRLGGPFDERTQRKVEKLGIVRPLGDGRFEIPSPTLLRAGEELLALGIPLSHVIAVGERIQRACRSIAEAFVRLFIDDVAGRVPLSQRTPDDWERLSKALARLRPLAVEAVRASFHQTMTFEVEKQVERQLRR